VVLNLDKLKLDCKTCTKEQKEDRGCTEDSIIPGRWQIGDEKFERCPIEYINSDIYWYIKAYNFMEKGILPRDGGWMNQSNKFIEGISFITKELNHGKK